ncbi:cryptochrome/photolyase family protein [Coraliomargarita akajimensis]|uniref:Deoxyribodipyrimidine photo-lyase n=1 Tax=Coraliomargarita akajimensis (strain DSM 45221 / IAM 15411 / JCM 23193 / KCTC 12865 / 04OKA010-24) TaxID=583355 RepID=D5EKL7_CORAD|nr:deoxyribodipyrimidine photo-lyase [Coraliomargarita akajimensis]ADE54924.1 Deoxyribodipyrimidine photo-lyase [Coraliomargarita akajimensis DSM 45221]
MSAPLAIVWFRNDLRFSDNAALAAAIAEGNAILPVFIRDQVSEGRWPMGAASKWWLHESLKRFAQSWNSCGGDLIFRNGDSLAELRAIAAESGATSIYWNRRYEGHLREQDAQIKRELFEDGLEVKSYNSSLLNEPHTIGNKEGRPYKVYTPYFKAVKDRPVARPVVPDLTAMAFPDELPQSLALDALDLLPSNQWYRKFESKWEPSEEGAKQQVDEFLSLRVERYDTDRDRPDLDGTSALSPYLHFGQIGPRQLVHELELRADLEEQGPFIFLKEIYWREFAYNVLYHFPRTAESPLQPQYESFPWEQNADLLSLWKRGKTGYPIVDAGMRQLWQTGWMHNRVRMIVSSLLVKHLLQDWKEGARWFWDTLVDADLASNTLGWQWSGGCGADAAPYFRIFNPMIQGKKFDPEALYVRRFVPELSRLPNKYIHEPWEAPDEVLAEAGIELGVDYPYPVVEHAVGRQRALSAYESFRA